MPPPDDDAHIHVVGRREIHRGRIFTLNVDRVTLPTGHTVDMEVIRHPGSVVLLPVPAPGQIVLIRQYRYALDRVIWELPAGCLNPDENADQAAARECEEEIGLVPGRVERLAGFYPTPGFCDELMNFYLCSELRPPGSASRIRKDDDEEIEATVMSIDDARLLVQRGDIVDMKTVVGLGLL